ncbi:MULTISPECIES: membrane protein insertase YidC [Rubrivivax]|uniref:membrane protein insertase YidC n=1 Tax=Rubrivivax TaxID=28067 RepID=UPI00020A4C6E|nr:MULTISPECIES: membrane protein insertase YidC [Rubrivivax]EGJ10158.1 yidc translocase/secretase [Rubrivivax benzoatilyticus JA2 = ATCC BAA-35]MCC9596735.1 membrane protein insertase YidC [Rubrivivax sp. JA1055]MCC9648892.1 membrane protein insertase YidC [Rubrivivax sp. JA1029]
MTDIRRTILWVVFVTSLFLLWDAWNKHNGQPSLFGGPARPAATAASAPGSAASAGVPTASAVQTPAGAVPQPAAPAGGEQVVVTTDLVKATFDSIGGQLVRLELLNYRDANHPDQNVVLLDRVAAREYVAQTGLITGQAGVALPTHLTPMTVAPGARTLADGQDSLTLRFETAPLDGRRLVKTYTFKRGDYAVGVRHEFVNEGSTPVTPQLYLQLARDGNAPEGESHFYSTFTGPAMFTSTSKYKKIDFKDIAKNDAGHDKTANDGWIAMVQHYFASAWIVNAEGQREFRTAKIGDNLYTIAMVLPMGEVAPGASKALESQLFVGPQLETSLAALAPGLEYLKDYGWLMPLSKPLFWLLDKLNSAIGNWGWAIVALVVLLKIAFYWLNASAYKSMAKMRAINPRVMEMRERYKDKPQQMQQEMMRIYREEKVNPLGGCLPILIQMPFFIALYWVLLSSVEMRNAPWIGWITDLSAKDPWFILPILMTASSLVQVALGAKPPDPMQARLMWFMPLAFGVMFFFFPAGLVLYWLTNNVLSIAQQWYINKKLGVA